MKNIWIFDFDGTIADNRESFYDAFRQACLQMKTKPPTPDGFLDVFEGNMFEGLHRLGLNKGQEARFTDHLKYFLDQTKESVSLFPGMGEMLDELGKKTPVYVITSNDSSFVRDVLEGNSIVSIRAVLGGDIDISKVVKIKKLKKQHPDHATYYVGDTCGDILEAHRAKAIALAVSWGWHDSARLQQAIPEILLQNPSDILDVENRC